MSSLYDIFHKPKYNIVVCAIAKNEHLYINEWVGHYIKLGVDKIFLYDNDESNSKYVGDFIDNKYKSKVEIINKRGVHKKQFQQQCYQNFYDKHNKEFNWCLFCDIDEFIDGTNNIKDIVKNVPKNINQVRIKWRLFGDDNIIERDVKQPVFKSFTHIITKSLNRNLIDEGTLENQGKFVLRGGLKNIVIPSPHYAVIENKGLIPSCMPSGKMCKGKVVVEGDYSKEIIFLNHYMTKSLKEFVDQKVGRGDAVYKNRQIDLDYFWRINEKTPEKLEWLEKFL